MVYLILFHWLVVSLIDPTKISRGPDKRLLVGIKGNYPIYWVVTLLKNTIDKWVTVLFVLYRFWINGYINLDTGLIITQETTFVKMTLVISKTEISQVSVSDFRFYSGRPLILINIYLVGDKDKEPKI